MTLISRPGLAVLLIVAVVARAPAEPRVSSPPAGVADTTASPSPGSAETGAPAGDAGSSAEAAFGKVAGAQAPSLGSAAARVAGATAVVGVLLALTLLLLRRLFRGAGRSGLPRLRPGAGGRMAWLSRWVQDAASDADRLEVLDRRAIGVKESVCIVRAGGERFLIGVTTSRVCLLGRLEPVREAASCAASSAPVEDPGHADFGRAALGAVAEREPADDASFRALLDRSRQRLARLGIDSAHAGARRE